MQSAYQRRLLPLFRTLFYHILKRSATIIALFCLFETVEAYISYIHSDFKQDEEELLKYCTENGFKLISPFRKDIIQVYHPKCESVFFTSPSLLLDGWGCPECSRLLTDAELFTRIFKTETKGEYTLLSPYTSINSDILIKHNSCGKEYTVNAGNFIRKKIRCSCKRDQINTKDNALRIMKEQFPDFELVDFTDFNRPVKILCKVCGRISTYSRFYYFLDRKTCKICDPSYYDEYGFREKICDLTGFEYSLTGPYVNAHTDVLIRHNRCGNTFKVQPRNFIRGKRCNICLETYETIRFITQNDLSCLIISGTRVQQPHLRHENILGGEQPPWSLHR